MKNKIEVFKLNFLLDKYNLNLGFLVFSNLFD